MRSKNRASKRVYLFLLRRSFIVLLALALHSGATTAQTLESVKVQLEWKYQFEFAGFLAALENGYYADVGLDVDLIEYESGTDNMSQLLNGTVDYSIHNSSIAISESRIAPVVVLASYLQRSPLIFVTQPDIKTPQELVGKRIMATTEESRYSSLALMLDHFVINRENSNFIEHSFDVTDFIDGSVDAMTAFRSNQLFLLDKLGADYNVIDPADYGFVSTAVNVIAARDQLIQNTDRAKRFVEASNRGWQYAMTHPDEIIDLILRKYNTQNKSRDALEFEADATRTLMQMDFFPIGHVSSELTRRIYWQLQRSGLIKDQNPVEQLTLDEVMARLDSTVELSAKTIAHLKELGEIRLCITRGAMPLQDIQNGRYVGVLGSVTNQLFDQYLPVPLTLVVNDTWTETLEAARTRRCDVLDAISETPDRREFLSFSQPYFELSLVLATRDSHPFVDELSQLAGQKIGYQENAVLPDSLFTSGVDAVAFNNYEDGLSAVERGDITGFVGHVWLLSNLIQQEHSKQLKISGRLPEKQRLSFGVRNDDPILVEVFEAFANLIISDNTVMQRGMNDWISVREQTGVSTDTIIKWAGGFVIIASMWGLFYLRLKRYSRRLEQISITDPLTGLFNRVHGDRVLEESLARGQRYGEKCGLMMLDVDYFKAINDQHGHQIGDRVLKRFATTLRSTLRSTDIACRWGGEEFLVICPHSNIEETTQAANKIVSALNDNPIGPNGDVITASIGVTECPPGVSADICLHTADQALYSAKNNGRNQVIANPTG